MTVVQRYLLSLYLPSGILTVKFSLPLRKPQILNPQLNLLTLKI